MMHDLAHDSEPQRADHTRRQFCVHACQAVSLLTLGSVLQGCGSPTSADQVPLLPQLTASVVSGGVTVTVGPSSPLASVGGAALVQSAAGNFLVARTAQTAFTALTAVCTHQACTVNGFESPVYVCPCHGSRYNLQGGVVQGPAPASLRQFQTDFTGDLLTIRT